MNSDKIDYKEFEIYLSGPISSKFARTEEEYSRLLGLEESQRANTHVRKQQVYHPIRGEKGAYERVPGMHKLVEEPSP